jgi:hypothetical protein
MKINTVSFFIVLTVLSITIPKELWADPSCPDNTECIKIDTELISPSGDYRTLRTIASTKLATEDEKNVVIGTATDTGRAKLYVTGNARVAGKIRASNGLQVPQSDTDNHLAEGALWLKTG